MGMNIRRVFKIQLATLIMITLLFIGSLSPILISELSNSKSSYYNVRSSTSNSVDVPVWLVGDEWVYETSIDVSPAIIGTDLALPLRSVSLGPWTRSCA